MKAVPFKVFKEFGALQATMQALNANKYDDFKQSYHVKRFSDEIEKEHKILVKMHEEVMKDAEWEKGEEGGEPLENPKILNQEHIDIEIEKLLSTTFKMEWAPLPISILESLNPTPEQYNVLDAFIDIDESLITPETLQ